MRLTDKEKEKIEKLEEYMYIDGSHHKQYALVEIIKMIYGKKYFDICYPDVDKGIPA